MNEIQNLIELRDVSFSYGGVPVLEKVDLQIREGEFLGIVGPNAGGKSTLLKLILGLLEPQSGHIRVLGKRPKEARQLLGYVRQSTDFPREVPGAVEQAGMIGGLGWRSRNGPVVGQKLVDPEGDVMIITAKGKLIRTGVKGIKVQGRNTQGVKVIGIGEDDRVVRLARLSESST